ncbi:hypothetical protein AVEN_268851-1 [Araneus ventricosus]|uniref:Uncharacterized protein n=1 Tax=Araneus ventricosus TaxID=182803 RepID=A0A4Y2TFT8_ARAVE|nr:hypothetical protein AVEN_268851-1 [Araneus ventricosus]
MLPVDGRQLENVKGELLKLKKKEAANCPTMAQRGQDRRAEETEEQRKENTFWGKRNTWHNVEQERRTEETEEQRNRRLAVMALARREEPKKQTTDKRNSRLAVMAQRGARREEPKKQKNKEIADWQ